MGNYLLVVILRKIRLDEMAHSKTIQFYRNSTIVRPDTTNNKTALTVAKETLEESGSKQDGEMTLIRYQEGDSDPVKTLVGIYYKNGNTGTWSYLTENDTYTKTEIDETEETIAQALSDLDERVTENTTAIDSMSDLSDRMEQAESDITEIREIIEENEEITAGALADLDIRLVNETTEREALAQAVEDDERVIAQGFAQLDEQINGIESDLNSETLAREALEQVVEDNELVTARALTELNNKINANTSNIATVNENIPRQASDIDAVPVTRTVNGFELSNDVTVGKPTIYLDVEKDLGSENTRKDKLVVFGAEDFLTNEYTPILLRCSHKSNSRGWHHYKTYDSNHVNVVTVVEETLSSIYNGEPITRNVNVVKLNSGDVLYEIIDPIRRDNGTFYVPHGKKQYKLGSGKERRNAKVKWGFAFIKKSDLSNNPAVKLDIGKLATNIAPFNVYYSWSNNGATIIKSLLI